MFRVCFERRMPSLIGNQVRPSERVASTSPILTDKECTPLRRSPAASAAVTRNGMVIASVDKERRNRQSLSRSALKCVKTPYTTEYKIRARTGERIPPSSTRCLASFITASFLLTQRLRQAASAYERGKSSRKCAAVVVKSDFSQKIPAWRRHLSEIASWC